MTTPDSATNFRALLLMIAGMTALASNDAILKHLGESFSAGQIMGSRGLVVCVILSTFMLVTKQPIQWRQLVSPWSLGRGLCELFATVCFITSLLTLPLALATTLVFVSPLMLTAVSGALFGESVGKWRWLAVCCGFAGVVVVSWRGGSGVDSKILLPLATAVGVVGRDICTRYIPARVSSLCVTLTTALVVTIGGLMTLPFGWQSVTSTQFGWICLAATIITISFFCYIVAIRTGELSLLAPIQYIVIVWALIYGLLFWSEFPDMRSLIGGSIIVASGILVLWREKVSRKN